MQLNQTKKINLFSRYLLRSSLFIVFVFASGKHTYATTFTVTTTADTGPGSLRDAITNANGAGSGLIDFNISGIAPHTILPLTALPIITANNIIIDGTTQPANGYSGASPKIIIDGAGITANGLEISANFCEVYGLFIKGFNQSFQYGIYITSSDCIVGAINKGNVISGNYYGIGTNIFVNNLFIKGNKIGTDPTGTIAIGNFYGIVCNGITTNINIGGSAPGEGNLISGNTNDGIRAVGINTGMIIKGNVVGTDITGAAALGNLSIGISLPGSNTNVIIGGGASGEGNLVSGNTGGGIILAGSNTGVIIKGNKVGTDISGAASLGNLSNGIGLPGSNTNTTIGGGVPGEGNLVSGNNGGGIVVNGSNKGVIIKGNTIGTDVTGLLIMGNKGSGIDINNCKNLTIGGSGANEGNIISGNGTFAYQGGISLLFSFGITTIYGNRIGTDYSGTIAMGNSGFGIKIYYTDSTLIGGAFPNQYNIIANNAADGITLSDVTTSKNRISRCLFYNNGAKGINLNNSGNINYPAPAITNMTSSSVSGTSNPNDTIELFYNHTGNSNPQGMVYIAATTADGLGNWIYNGSLNTNSCITATASDNLNNTSEFSVVSSLILNTSPSVTICRGNSTSLAATVTTSGGVTYSWSPSAGLSSTSISNPIASPANTTTYTCTCTGTGGVCSNSVTKTITVTVKHINLSQTVTNVKCHAACDGQINTIANGGIAPYTYNWTNGSSNAGCTNLCPGSYTVTVTDSLGCLASADTAITEPAVLSNTITATPPASCNGTCDGSASASASGGTIGGGYSYSWNTMPVQNSAAATGLCAGNFICTVTDNNLCTTINSVTIPPPSVSITASLSAAPAICSSSTGSAAVAASGSGPYTYSWSSGGTGTIENNLAAGTYTVTITNTSTSCSKIDSVTVTSNNPLLLSTTATQTACASNNGTAACIPSNGTAPYTFSWNTIPNQVTQTASALGVGIYTVSITDAHGCTQSQTASVSQIPGPTAVVTGSANVITLGENTQLAVTGGLTYQWFPASDLSCTACQNPIAIPLITAVYCAQVTDINSCKDTACITINVEIPCSDLINIIIPNAFSPNNDGHNDKFHLQGWQMCIKKFNILIFNRWGEKVFESDDVSFSWDGTYSSPLINGGKADPVDPDVFVYYIKATDLNDKEVLRKGNISVIH